MAEGCGTVKLGSLTIFDVWFVPELRVNLISVDAFNSQGYDVNCKRTGEAWIVDEAGRVIAIAQKKNNLRHLVIDDASTVKPSESAFIFSAPDSTFVPNINPSAPPPESILPEVKLLAEPTLKISGIEI